MESGAYGIGRYLDETYETALPRVVDALKAEGFRFVGPTTVYAFMQSTGMVNDHIVVCHRHGPCAKLQKAFRI